MEKSGFLEQNVEESNKLVAKIMAFTIVLLIGAWILNFTNVFAIKDSIMTISCIAGVLILLVPLLAIYVLKIGNSTVKYINIICAALFVSILSTTLSFHVAILYLYPIIIGSIYFTKKVNYLTAAFTVVGTTAAQFISYQIEPEFDENVTSMSEMVTYSLIPRMICFVCVFCVFCILNNRISKLLGNVLGAEEQEKVYNKMKRMTDKSSEASKTLIESAEKLSTVADENLLKIADITDNTEAVVSSSMETLNELNKVEANINTIAESISELAEHSQQVQNLSDDVTNITKENSAVMEQAIKSMNQISDSTKNSKKIIQELEDKSNEINGIVDTITGISSQTNLLALNAAIEAARAGDQGKGFAVVAEEIRKLAEQTQAAVLSIGNIISTIIAQTGEAAAAMDSNVILTQEGTGIISKADSSSNDMSTAGNSMHEKILEMNVVTKQVAEKSNEIKEIIVNLSESSRKNTEGLNKVSEANASSYDNMKELEEMVKNINSISEEINEIVASV